MIALLRKDLPWLLFFLIGGTVAFAIAIVEEGFIEVFLMTPHRVEGVFSVAVIGGLLLGAVAACFDEALATREFLMQRPVAASRIAAARLVGCGAVLVTWSVLPIGCAWLWQAVFLDSFIGGEWYGVPETLATMTAAASCAAIGCCAASLPLPWWQRLLGAGALFYAVFLAAHLLARTDAGESSPSWYAGVHLVSAAVLFAIARQAMAVRFDADRPLPAGARRLLMPGIVLSVAVAASAGFAELEVLWLRKLERAYPQLAVVDGTVVMLRQVHDDPRFAVVDAQHRPTPRLVARDQFEFVRGQRPQRETGADFDVPRWRTGRFEVRYNSELLLRHDGRVWALLNDRQQFQAVGKPAVAGVVHARPGAFAPGTRLAVFRDGDVEATVLAEPEARELWRYDGTRQLFERVPLPQGDRFAEFSRLRPSELSATDPMKAALQQVLAAQREIDFVRGELGSYVLANGTLQAFTAPPPPPQPMQQSHGYVMDNLSFAVDLAQPSSPDKFRHEFTPRTAEERLYAALSLVHSLLRVPVAQASSHWFGSEKSRGPWVDPLVRARQRLWLVVGNLAVAIAMAFATQRRLVRLTADSPTVRFWTVTALLFSIVGALASMVFERPRAHAQRALKGPFERPRILTPDSVAEASS